MATDAFPHRELARLESERAALLDRLAVLSPIAHDETLDLEAAQLDIKEGFRLQGLLSGLQNKLNRLKRSRARVTPLPPPIGLDILRYSEIHGDPYQGRMLDVAELEAQGLVPELTIESHLGTIHFSPPFCDGRARWLYLGYVEHERRLIVRSFVRSHSQVVLRGISGYGVHDGKFSWYGKSLEQSLLLGLAFQAELARLADRDRTRLPLQLADPDRLIAGLNRLKGWQDNLPFTPRDEERITSHESNPRVLRPRKTIRPDETDYEPDFTLLLDSFTIDSPLYGETTVELYPSHNGIVEHAFCRDRLDRVWHAGSEVCNTTIGSTGLNTMWCEVAGLLNTPAYEYSSQLAYFGLEGNRRLRRRLHGSVYIDTMDTILRGLPVIRSYYEARGIAMPTTESLTDP